jgi:hypothetical protein
MSDDVLITPASRKVEFFDSAGNIDGKIELDSNGDLNITSTGSIAIGDITQDIHVGDGTQAVDLVFDFTSSIYSVANQDLTIGKKSLGGNDVKVDSPSCLRIDTDSGYVEVGPKNASWSHFYTDRAKYYFNKGVIVDEGIIGSYNEDLKLVTDQNETRVTIKATDGDVGIGNTDPISKLHVSGDTTIYDTTNEAHLVLRRDATGTNYGSSVRFEFGDSGGASSGHLYARMVGAIQDSTNGSEDGYLRFDTSKDGTITEQMRIDKDGNVGIGTTSLAAQLHVEQDDGAVHGLKVYRNDSSTSTSLAYFHDDSVYVDNPTLHVKNDRADQYGYAALLEGRVGIGITGNMVTQPDQVLHVEGSILVDAFNQGKTTLASNYSDGATSLVLTDSSTFNEKGTGTINGVEFNWTAVDHSTNTLTVPDLDANYTAGVTVAADTGLFFREGFENDIQPSITIYDNANSGVSRDDLSINAYSAIRMQLNDSAELKLTDDKLSLTPGNEDVASFVFRNRNDLGMFESGYNLQLASPENVYIQIDSNNNNTDTKAFIVQKNASGVGGGTELFRVHENGKVGIGEDDPGSLLEIRGATTIGTTTGHVMLTGDSATNGQGPQIVFSESGSGSSFAGAYIGHVRTGSNSMGDLVFATRQSSGDANTVPTEVMRLKGGTSPEITTAANITSTSANNYNLYWPLYFQRDNLGTSNIDLRLPNGGSGTTAINQFAMPRAGKVMAFTIYYYGGTISTSGSDTDTWRIRRLHSGGTEVTEDTVVAMDTTVASANANNRNVTVELSTPMAFNANESIAFKRGANSGHSIHEVSGVLWIHFDA